LEEQLDIRPVLRHTCDENGRIAFLFGAWGAVAAATAIEQIEVGACSYFVQLREGMVATFEPLEVDGVCQLKLFTASGQPLRTAGRDAGRMGA
jgi:hypothetical protein